MIAGPAEIVLKCEDLDEAIQIFTSRLGFRLEMIMPADDPALALISGHGVSIRLVADKPVENPIAREGLLITRAGGASQRHAGRAGMWYRDLIPGRLGGRAIASLIGIPDGGEVPDYVHYHKVQFQMIYCRTGWVRVVYQGQGPSFVLGEGDCVLQPPGIRHRVIEASTGLEVIEISVPAIHETWADHDLELPDENTAQLFDGQQFLHFTAAKASWRRSPESGIEICDMGISSATNGVASSRILKAAAAAPKAIQVAHAGDMLFLYILDGKMTVIDQQGKQEVLHPEDCCCLPSGIPFTILPGAGSTILEVTLPASTP